MADIGARIAAGIAAGNVVPGNGIPGTANMSGRKSFAKEHNRYVYTNTAGVVAMTTRMMLPKYSVNTKWKNPFTVSRIAEF